MSSVPHFESLPTDHRDLDPRVADVAGLAAGQPPVGARPDRPVPGAGEPVWHGPDGSASTSRGSYYDRPVVKAPPWGQKVSAYVVVGGVAGAAATLAGTAQMLGGDELGPLVRSARMLSTGAAIAGSGLLVSDLGRPERFFNMVRVVKPTSAMNIGGYCLSATAAASVGATLLGERRGRLGQVGATAGVLAGIAGIPLCGYTGVLLSTTAMPAWNVGAQTLPPLFMASAAATVGSVLRLAPIGPSGRRSAAVFATIGQSAELVAEFAHERALRDRPSVRASYERTRGWRAGRALTIASLLLSAAPPTRRRRAGAIASALLGVTGSTLTKMAVFDAGIDSARDPRAVAESC